MAGKQNGVGARLQKVCKIIVHSHCISHKLAFACSDANDTVKCIFRFINKTLLVHSRWLSFMQFQILSGLVANKYRLDIISHTNLLAQILSCISYERREIMQEDNDLCSKRITTSYLFVCLFKSFRCFYLWL